MCEAAGSILYSVAQVTFPQPGSRNKSQCFRDSTACSHSATHARPWQPEGARSRFFSSHAPFSPCSPRHMARFFRRRARFSIMSRALPRGGSVTRARLPGTRNAAQGVDHHGRVRNVEGTPGEKIQPPLKPRKFRPPFFKRPTPPPGRPPPQQERRFLDVLDRADS